MRTSFHDITIVLGATGADDGGRRMGAARVLTAVTAGLLALAAGAGLLVGGAYEARQSVVAAQRGHDVVAALIAVPLLVLVITPRFRTSVRGQLVWLGTLLAVTYGAALSAIGLGISIPWMLHVAVLVTASYALLLALSALDTEVVQAHLAPRAPKVAAVLLGLLGIGLGLMWLVAWLRFAFTGEVPAEPTPLVVPAEMTQAGALLDLWLLVPAYVAAAALLWRGSAWGVALAPALLVGGLLQQVSYTAALAVQALADVPGAPGVDPFEPVIVLAYAAAAAVLLVPRRLKADHPESIPRLARLTRRR